MRAEMAEQPAVLDRLLARRAGVERALRPLREPRPAGVVLVARGSSDNAAVYGRYLLEQALGVPVGLAAPSLYTRYGGRPDLRGHVAVAVSQSGRTPEIVDVSTAMRELGARTVAITNDGGSPLAAATDVVVELAAGAERAVPATKTVTATMLAFVLVAAALGTPGWSASDAARIPEDVARTLGAADPVRAVAAALPGKRSVAFLGRGFSYAAALESALKLKETTGLVAEGYSTADFLHGPVRIAAGDVAACSCCLAGPAAADVAAAMREAVDRGAVPVDLGVRTGPWPGAGLDVTVPEPLAALPLVVRGQQLAWAAAAAMGVDPDRPAGLSKVTETH